MTKIEITKNINKLEKEDEITIPLISDIGFKAVHMREKKVLYKIINSIFKLGGNYIPFTMVGYETVPIRKNGKTYRGDILIRLNEKSYVMVEMNQNKSASIIDRNMVNATRVLSQLLEKGTKDSELKKHRIRVLNLNLMPNESGNPIEHYAVCNTKTGEIASLMYTFCNVDIEKCREVVYNYGIENAPEEVRWCAILGERNIKRISDILGDELLSMEEKENYLKTIREVNNDGSILQEWMIEEKERLKKEDEMNTAYNDGVNEGIEKGIEKGIEQGIDEKNTEVIIKMLEEGIDYTVISKVTGKSIEEIKNIEKQKCN